MGFSFLFLGKAAPFDRVSSSQSPPDDAQWKDISYGSISGAPTRPAQKRTPHRVLDVRVVCRARGTKDFFSCCVKKQFLFFALHAQATVQAVELQAMNSLAAVALFGLFFIIPTYSHTGEYEYRTTAAGEKIKLTKKAKHKKQRTEN